MCILHKDFVHKKWQQPFFTLNHSGANNWIFPLCIAVELSFSKSLVHNLDTPFLMPFHEVYLLGYFISYYGTSIPMCSNQSRRQKKLSLSFSAYECSPIVTSSLKHAIFCLRGYKYLLHEYQNPVYYSN